MRIASIFQNLKFLPALDNFSQEKFHQDPRIASKFRILTPLKNPSRRDGGTKPEALVPPALRDGFLRGV